MNSVNSVPMILLAEDDMEERDLTHRALRASDTRANIHDASDGRGVLRFLRDALSGAPGCVPLPGLILLDLRMPHQDGFSALAEIRSDPRLRNLPVVILSTSENPDDIVRCYDLGANSYVSKPMGMRAFTDAMSTLLAYWFGVVELPATVRDVS